MKKTLINPATETKSANAKATKAASKAATKAEKTAKTEATKTEKPATKTEKTAETETAPKTVELPDPAKMTKDDYKKVSRKMRRLRREGRKDEAAQLETIVAAAKKNLGIGAKAEKVEKAEKPAKTEKSAKAEKAAKPAKKGSSKKSSDNFPTSDGFTPSFANGGLQRHLLTFPA